jgi:hypothetical protein
MCIFFFIVIGDMYHNMICVNLVFFIKIGWKLGA